MDGFLPDDDRAGQQRGQRAGQMLLGELVGDGHQIVGAGLLDDLVHGELPEPGRDLGRGGLADRFFDIGQVMGEKVIDHASIEARASDIPCPGGAGWVESV